LIDGKYRIVLVEAPNDTLDSVIVAAVPDSAVVAVPVLVLVPVVAVVGASPHPDKVSPKTKETTKKLLFFRIPISIPLFHKNSC
jgi:hypothetical protein